MANYWMDVYMWGKYPIAAMRFLEEKDGHQRLKLAMQNC